MSASIDDPHSFFRSVKIAGMGELWQLRGAPELSPFFFREEPRPLVRWDADRFGPDRHSSQAKWLDSRSDSLAEILWQHVDEDTIDDTAFGVSRSKLFDRTRRESDPSRYVETLETPYLTLPMSGLGPRTGVKLGDLAVVIHPRVGSLCFAVIGDGREMTSVESSIYLREALGLEEAEVGNPGCIYLIFPDSGRGQGTIPSLEQIQARGERLYLGGTPRPWSTILAECFADDFEGRESPVDRTLAAARGRLSLSRA